jgi:hypothetical protein
MGVASFAMAEGVPPSGSEGGAGEPRVAADGTKSIHDLVPLETGGPAARQGFLFQDHVAAWPELMRRVFAVDVLQCPDCHGPMRNLPPTNRTRCTVPAI